MAAGRKKATRKKTTVRKAGRKKVARKKTTRKKASAKKTGRKKAAPKKAARKKAARKKATPKKAARKKTAPKKAARKKAAPKKTARKKAAPKKAARKKTAPKKAAPKKAAPKKAAPAKAKATPPKPKRSESGGLAVSAVPATASAAQPEDAKVAAGLSTRIGVVTHYFGKVGAGVISIESGELHVGDTIHIRGHTTDFYQRVNRIEIEHQQVEVARAGQSVGVEITQRVREHDEVFKVSG